MTKYWITGFSPFTNATEMPRCFLNTAKSSAAVPKEEQSTFKDCAEVFKSGLSTSGIYTLTFPNSTEEIKVRKDALQQSWGLPWVTEKAKEPLSTHSSCPSQAHSEGSAVTGYRAGMLSMACSSTSLCKHVLLKWRVQSDIPHPTPYPRSWHHLIHFSEYLVPKLKLDQPESVL